MRHASILALLVFAFSILVLSSAHGDHGAGAADTEESDPDVFVLSKDNFEEHITDNEFVFVDFYAPWCGHCKRLAPEWGKLATKIKDAGHKISVAKLDATQAEDLALKYGIRGYPSLKFFRNGSPVDYEGGRTIDEMYNYIVRKSGPSSRLLNSIEEVNAFVSGAGTKLVAYIEDTAEWLSAAASGKLEDFQIAHVTDSSLFGESKKNSLHIHREGDDDRSVYDGQWLKDQLLSFVETEGYPLVDELAQKIWQRSQTTSTPLLAGFIGDEPAHKDMLKELAKKYKGKLLVSQSSQATLADRWGATGKVLPTGIVVQWKDGEPKMTVFDEEAGEFTAETAEQFINDALAGTYKSYRKSEPVPENNDEAVKVLVGKNFDEIVKDQTKDVFVEFYAPWCGHCKKLAPIWDELGELFEDQKNIVIAKMDATANAAPEGLDIRGFPTLIFFPADNKDGVPYNGERDLDSLMKFVKEKASHAVQEEGGKVDL